MRIYVLHDSYEETEFYAEANVIEVSALVTEESEGYYYKHQWMIDEFEV